MPVVRLLLAYWPVVVLFVVVAPAMWLSLRQAPEEPAGSVAYSRRGVPVEVEEDPWAWWALLPTEDQRDLDDLALGPGARLRQTPLEAAQERLDAMDRAFLDPGAQAALDAEEAACAAAEHLAYRAQINARFHP